MLSAERTYSDLIGAAYDVHTAVFCITHCAGHIPPTLQTSVQA